MSMTYYAVTDDPNELAHWGIKGMKWGVRHDKPRHSGSRRPRSVAYKKAQSKLSRIMKSGIKRAEAHWKAYNSPKAREDRFMKKAMQQARNGTLKYGKLTDAQVKKVTDRLYLERQARQLGSTENPSYVKRLKTAVGEGIVRGIGTGTGAYIEERMRGRGRTTADIKRDKRMAKYESDQEIQQRKARNKVNQEYYEEAAKRGYEPGLFESQSTNDRAKQLRAWKERDAREEERTKRQNAYQDVFVRAQAANRAKIANDRRIEAMKTAGKLPASYSGNNNQQNNQNQNNNNNGPGKGQSPIVINVNGSGYGVRRTGRYGPNGQIVVARNRPKRKGRS